MARWQVVEKDDYGTDWHIVRYDVASLARFKTPKEAIDAAKLYLTSLNCDNVLTADEKRNSLEAFMQTANGIYLGVLDQKNWFLTYPKDMVGKNKESGERETLHTKGEIIEDPKYYELEGKTEVAVRIVPGTENDDED